MHHDSADKVRASKNQQYLLIQPQTGTVLQNVAAALLMSEAVYKAVDGSLQQAVADISRAAELPAALQQNLTVQWSLPHVPHRQACLAFPHSAVSCSFERSLTGHPWTCRLTQLIGMSLVIWGAI